MLSSNFGRKRSWNPAERAVIEITAPFQRFVTGTIRYVEGVWLNYFDLVNAREENRRLKKQIDSLKMENDRCRELLAASNRLRELLHFTQSFDWPGAAAQVIGRDPSGWFKSVIINEGEKAGLKVNMPVVNADGVVGRLVSLSSNYAKVLLIIDRNSAVDCIVQRSREKGIIKGVSEKLCTMEYVVRTGDVREGDVILTSGMGRVFPKGLPLGTVTKVTSLPGNLFLDIRVQPMVDFSKLEEVLVVLKEDPLSIRPRE